MSSERIGKLYESMHAMEIDALVLNPGPSLTYLTGLQCHLMERPIAAIFVPGKDPALILPQIEEPKLSTLAVPVQPFIYSESPERWLSLFRQAMQYAGLDRKTIGMEPRQLRILEYQYLQNACQSANFQDASSLIASLRAVKSREELDAMRKAADIAVLALESALANARIGMTERELAAELVMQLLRHGSEPTLPFPPIVATGPNSANPHAVPTDRPLVRGDILLIDWGACANGYMSDLTRTFAVGALEEEAQEIHAIVLAANAAGRKTGGPGVPCAMIDHAARDVIDRQGFAAQFTHRTGHGLGLECHEEPYIRGDNQLRLEPGMTYTVEPGIYLSGRFGVRIEDDMVVTTEGAELLCDCPRELRVIDG